MRIVSIAILLFLYTFSIAKDKADIAVMGVRATGVSKKMTASITDLISQEVEQMGLYRVIKHKQVQAMLAEVTDNSLLECSAVECLRDLGGILGVDLLISGSIGKSGNTYTINLQFTDILNQETIASVTEKCTGAETELYNILGSSLIKLFAEKPEYRQMVLKYADRSYQYQDKKGEFTVYSSLKGSKVWVDGKLQDGTSPLSRIGFPAGDHRVVVKKDGAYGAADIVVHPDKPLKLKINMVKGAGSLEITSNPAGAKVLLDGTDKGATPAKLSGVEAGVHVVELQLDGHVPVIKKVFVGDKAAKKVNISLPKAGCLDITAIPERALVLVNNEYRGSGPRKLCGVPAGKPGIFIRGKNYEDFQGAIPLKPGETKKVEVNLVHTLAILDVKTEPTGADVLLNGKKAGTTNFRNDDLPLGAYKLKVALPTYKEILKDFNAEKNKRYEYSYKLEHTEEFLLAAKKKRMLIRKIIFGSVGTVLAGAGYYMNMQVDKNVEEQDRIYEEYNQTVINVGGRGGDYQDFKDEWDALDKQIDQYVLLRTILYVLSGCSYAGMGVSFVF